MGLLLSVLVACVGVIELIAFYHNVRRNITSPPVHGNLTNISDRYRKELRGIQQRLDGDLQRAQDIPPPCQTGGIPTFRLNSHEDIEIEYDESLLRSRSASPRSFLVTEKEGEDRKSESPRRFVVSDEAEALKKSKSQDSIPEFLIHEQRNSPKSPSKPRYVLCEQQDESSHPIPLPRQFIVTEDELNTLVFDETCRPTENQDKDRYRRSPSPYPPLELPHVPRNSVCSDLLENPTFSVVEYDEDEDSSSSIPEKVDMILESTHFNTTQYWTNKVLVSPSKHHKLRHHSHGEHHKSNKEHLTVSERTRSKSESENQDSNNNLHAIPGNRAVSNFELSRSLEKDDATYDAKYLNSLDGVSRSKQKHSRKAFVKRKNASSGSLDRAKSSISETPNEDTTKTLSEAVEELKKISENDLETKDKTGEPFWLIFSGEYTKAMNKDWHGQHFCCWQCDESLTGQRYVLRDDHPYCVSCYESVFANACEKCSRTIGIDSKDLSYKDKHWHEACFLCQTCGESLVDKQFGSKGDRIYCGSCYDQQFASRCDGCHEIFRAGTKKMEYKTRQWHEKCFCCCVCKVPIGTQSFIPREQEIYCAKCYEEKFATRCIKCNKVITSGGVTYKNEPWHRECFTCTHCQKSLAGERFTSRDEKPYCAECFGELFAKRCTACQKPITGIGGTKFISFEDRHWHNDCFFCASCRTSLVGRGFITDGADIICPECAKQKLS